MSDALRIMHGAFGRAVLVRTNQSMSQHAHPTCQLLFKLDGPSIEVTVGNTRHSLGDNNVILLNAWEPHSLNIPSDQPHVTLLGIHIDPAWLSSHRSDLALSIHPSFFVTSCGPMAPVIRADVHQLANAITADRYPEPTNVEFSILQIVLALTQNYTQVNHLSHFEVSGGMRCDPRIRGALSLLQRSVGIKISPDDVASDVGMSRPHFFELFKRETRLTPMAYVNMLRLEAAFTRIARQRESLLNISLDLGFESPGNFTRFFSKLNGISPSEYRRRLTVI